jgi:hypothetical protein
MRLELAQTKHAISFWRRLEKRVLAVLDAK